jgi:DNA-directed RNA polymerase subunit L
MSLSFVNKPNVENIIAEQNDVLTFTISKINASIANALRRTIITNTKIPVFNILKTVQEIAGHNNQIKIHHNTTRLNNELIKQRLSCIPINFIDTKELYPGFPIEDCVIELNVENTTSTIIYATTGHFKIKNLNSGKYLPVSELNKIFPVNKKTKYYIDIVRLNPKIDDNILGESINLSCGISFSSVQTNSMFNSTSICYYTNTLDTKKIEIAEKKQIILYKKETNDDDELNRKIHDWNLIDAKRININDSFDYKIKTIGIFDNKTLIRNACSYINESLDSILTTLSEKPDTIIEKEVNILTNCYTIKITRDEYTIGKSLEYVLFSKFFEGEKKISFCGFKKLHPHDNHGFIKIALDENSFDIITIGTIIDLVTECINILKSMFNQIKQNFDDQSLKV